MGARFALVLEPKGGPAARRSALRLVDTAGTGARRRAGADGAARPGTIDAAVMRLDEAGAPAGAGDAQAGTRAAAAPPPGRRRSLAPPVLLAPPPPEGEASATIRPPGRAITGRC